jgi:hypothetical protein
VPGFRIPSKRVVPPAASENNTKPTPVLTVNLQDPSGYLSLAKQLNGSFGVTSAGRPDTQENRFAILMLKSYMLDQQKQLNTSDVDFLIMALSADKPSDLSTLPADVVGAWVLPNVSSISDNMTLNPLKAHEFSNSAGGEIEVGTLTITRDLPKLTAPTAADLMSAGTGK